jgi:hypothetical protein
LDAIQLLQLAQLTVRLVAVVLEPTFASLGILFPVFRTARSLLPLLLPARVPSFSALSSLVEMASFSSPPVCLVPLSFSLAFSLRLELGLERT